MSEPGIPARSERPVSGLMPDRDAVQLLSLGIGLGVQRAFDPDLSVASLVDLLRSLLESAEQA